MTPKQQRFVEEYLKDLNATQAATRAGYAHATTQGPRLLENVGVAKAIAEAQTERAERVQVTQDYVLSRLVMEAEREGEGSSHSARVSALEKLGKHLAMFTDRMEHEGQLTISGVQVSFERPDRKAEDG